MAEVQVERRKQRGTVGNIYKGRVTRVLPGMQSAFVDIGLEKDAFLYVADVGEEVDDFDAFGSGGAAATLVALPPPAEGAPGAADGEASSKPILPSIDELLREGQELVVQVTKDQIAHKGVRVSTHVTLPGRTLVYMPTIDHVGVSRRIENEDERDRLKDILTNRQEGSRRLHRAHGGRRARAGGVRGRPPLSHEALGADPQERRARGRAPTLLHRDLDLTLRAARRRLRPDFASALGRRRRGVPAHRRVPRPGAARARLEGEALPASRADLRGVRRPGRDREGSQDQGLAEVGRLHRHQPDRGARRDRREHGPVRRQEDASRTRSSRRTSRRCQGDRPADPAARPRRHHRARLHRHGGEEEPQRCCSRRSSRS